MGEVPTLFSKSWAMKPRLHSALTLSGHSGPSAVWESTSNQSRFSAQIYTLKSRSRLNRLTPVSGSNSADAVSDATLTTR